MYVMQEGLNVCFLHSAALQFKGSFDSRLTNIKDI